jgi:beta-ribofuranosylaminobenzene 5'-phosphate synthase
LPPFPAAAAADLCRLVMMQLLPALAEEDIGRFGEAIGILQKVVGDHFAPAQGGRFYSPAVTEVLSWLESEGIAGVGQSSWGPTGFAILGSELQAETIRARARARWQDSASLSFLICSGLNSGARISQKPAHESDPASRQLAYPN